MARPRLGHPFEVVLPSGAQATVTCSRADPLPRDLPEALRRNLVRSTIDLMDAPLADAHVVEAILCAIGGLHREPLEAECRNCKETVQLDGARALPLAPLLTPPGDPELDPPFLRTLERPLPRKVPVGQRAVVESFQLQHRTLADRVRMEAMLAEVEHLPLHARFLRAMGLVALGEVKSPSAMARALEHLDDETFDLVWDAIVEAWDALHYPPRLLSPVPCPKCGARHDVEVPAHRPLPLGRAHVPAPDRDAAPFPDLATFRARSAEITQEVLAETGLSDARGLEVVVEDGVPPCDEGGEPLLGSYTPTPEADGDVRMGATSPFVVALYYRTFRAMYEEDGAYDVDSEIRETIEHELEHHVGFLRGNDPLDEEERAEIERERTRVTGAQTSDRLAADVGWLFSDFARFWRTTWPIWLLALIAVVLTIAASR